MIAICYQNQRDASRAAPPKKVFLQVQPDVSLDLEGTLVQNEDRIPVPVTGKVIHGAVSR